MSHWRIVEGDCRESMAMLPERSVQTCVTSPPYFGLRDYGHDGQIGLEPTPDEFVAALVAVFREVRRVLRDDGTVWLNLRDSYVANGRYDAAYEGKRDRPAMNGGAREIAKVGDEPRKGIRGIDGMKPKDLIGIPWMVAFALRADGWYLRSDIIWSKPNPMPESVTDRPTKAHEYVFLLSKSARYFYDADAVREEHTGHSTEQRFRDGVAREHGIGKSGEMAVPGDTRWRSAGALNTAGRVQQRCVIADATSS